jgi:hypothetical protein
MTQTLADQPRRYRGPNRGRRQPKRGVVLLMVVSLLALFLLMGVTFAVLAMQYNSSAKMQAEVERYGDPPMLEMDLAFGQLLYDTPNRGSLQGASLLRDMYGNDHVMAQVSGNISTDTQKTCNGHFTVFGLTSTSAMSDVPGFYNGRVLTFITGNCAGFSTRIAGYEPRDPVSGLREVFIEPIRSSVNTTVTPVSGDEFVINGQPFNGMGYGYDRVTYRLDAVVDTTNNRPAVLLPHYAAYPERGVYSSSGGALYAPYAAGVDEAWDTPDYQNMALSLVPPGLLAARIGSTNQFTVPLFPAFHRPDLLAYWMDASRWPGAGTFSLQSDANHRDLARQIIFRPMPWDHPNFTGSNPDLTPTSNNDAGYEAILRKMAQLNALQSLGGGGYYEAIWDVDNDGDGVRESVWVDAGLPVMTAPNGRRYKRLFAYLVKDLDGRVNINVHGNKAQTDNNNLANATLNYPFPAFGPTAQPAAATFPNNNRVLPTFARTLQLPRGLGFGPAEVDFQFVMSAAGFGTTDYTTLLNGRYGPDGAPGLSGTDDPLSVLRMSGVPYNYVAQDSWYGSPPDVWGRSAVAVDPGGRPFFYRGGFPTTPTTASETWDDPYEMEWDAATAVNDTPYSVTDMEQLLRLHDAGYQYFPGRLANTLPNLFNNAGQPAANVDLQRVRESLTTMGSNVPVVPGVFRYQDRPANGTFTHTEVPTVVNLYKRRLQEDGTVDVTDPAALRVALSKLMPWEFWQGKPFNINRYLGNGVNDNSGTNWATDEPVEQGSGEQGWGTNGMTGSSAPSGGALPNVGGFSGQQAYATNGVDADNNGTPDQANDQMFARQLLARHLYCLILAIKDSSYNPPNVAGTQNTESTRKMIAQWAVNVVDFRDPDGIITGFEYDVNPWNGWDVDGNLATDNESPDRRVVWGCESPELILKEAIAFHDRRTKDTDHDPTTKERGETMDPDPHVDQFRVPQGSLFFELYCPRTHGMYNQVAGQEALYNPQMPFELYDKTTGKLALNRMSPNGQHPVWQVAVSTIRADATRLPAAQIAQPGWERANYRDPTDPAIMGQDRYNLVYDGTNTVEIDRYVWFTNNDGGMANPKRNRVFYNQRNWNTQLAPGQYMVVGPRETTHIGSNNTDVGSTNGYWHGNSPQRIVLNATTGVEIFDAAGNPTSKLSTPPATAEIQPVVAMVADTRPPDAWAMAAQANRRVGLNVTEPLPQAIAPDPIYYPEYNDMNDGRVPFDAYDDPATPANTLPDEPLDNTRLIGQANMLQSNVYANRAGIFLQRLADPTRDWDPRTNPYITVDFAPVDVTVFSGEEDTNRQVMVGMPPMPEDVDPSDPPPGNDRIPKLATGQRGVVKGNPWFPAFTTTNLTTPAPGSSTQRYMELGLHHTFGYLNESLGTIRGAVNGAAYAGDPADADRPFPWLTWNNRPFMNPAELLLVPTCAPNRLMLEMSPNNPVVPNAAGNPYTANTANDVKWPYGHLLNFFQSSGTDNTAMNLARLFDYVETPSNFVGNERWYSPNQMTGAGASPWPAYRPPHLYRPPFNSLSRFRDPGKINLNTISDLNVWKAIIGYDPGAVLGGLRTPADEFFLSRQGYAGSIGQMNQAYPSIFSNPFRPADAADLMPNAANMRKAPAEVGLLRQSTSRTGEPLLAYKSADLAIDTDRNPYFRYQGLQKIANSVGTQSNCYAVWVTVGYFEVEDTAISNTHPDGFMLGQELGLDTGETERHRAFYLIDRSIPVGFIPGLKLNTDNCVLLRRQID